MIRATSVLRRAAVKPERVADTITLGHEARLSRSATLKGEGGLEFLLHLERATMLDDGDAVKLEDGRLVRIKAAPERLLEVTTDNPARLMKVVYQLGSQHVATEIAEGAVYVGFDHGVLEMIRGLGAGAAEVTRPFRPEQAVHVHDHGHHHHHGHGEHDHHADACGCGHDHHHHDDHHHHHGEGHDHGHSHSHGGHKHG